MAAADLALIIGIIGNVTSVMVYASPIPTFWYIYKKKSTEYFSALPYVCTLLTVLMGLYYGCIKTNGMLIITINVIGLAFEAAYLTIFLIYATKFSRIKTLKQVLMDIVFAGVAVALTMIFTHGKLRILIVGSLCAAVAVSMYAAPLSIMKLVIRTKNVDFMPATLSAFLALNASLWTAYAFFVRDVFIGIPSALGTILSLAQILLYIIYKNKNHGSSNKKHQDDASHVVDIKDASDASEKQHKTGKVADASQKQQPEEQQRPQPEQQQQQHELELATTQINNV